MSLAFIDNACLCPLHSPSPPLNIAICPRKLSQAVKKSEGSELIDDVYPISSLLPNKQFTVVLV